MITREYNEADGIKIFDADIDESHTDYNAKGLKFRCQVFTFNFNSNMIDSKK